MAARDESQQLRAPGYRMPLDEVPGDMFDNALDDDGRAYMPLTTLREFTMMKLMDEITDKPGWEKKIFDDTITAKWKEEALASPGINNVGITQNMFTYVVAELQYKAQIFEETQAVAVYNGDVVKSDAIISESLRQSLIEAVKPLEDVPDNQRDWHPGSDDKVLDLVHPSLFPLVYGQTKITSMVPTNLEDCIERCGGGSVSFVPKDPGSYGTYHKSYSTKFQWLPCEVDISDQKASKITSYINNLHPQKHKDLYAVLEKIIDRAIPLWNLTLAPGDPKNDTGFRSEKLRIKYTECEYDHDNGTEIVRQPDVECDFGPPEKDDQVFDIKKKFAKKGLQVIVKLANIHLTPEKPSYDGGSWHVEGQMNEHICASAIYYYESANITASSLSFRQRVSSEDAEEIGYDQDDHGWLADVFGCNNWETAVQNIGSIQTIQGRLITFPNLLQHQVQPFKLEDTTKPGHRKILALFLVDPHIRIISTKHVPCQRLDWWKEAIEKVIVKHIFRDVSQTQSGQMRGFADLPKELRDLVYDHVDDFPISMKEAKELREELMEERSIFVDKQTQDFTSESFSLCEH